MGDSDPKIENNTVTRHPQLVLQRSNAARCVQHDATVQLVQLYKARTYRYKVQGTRTPYWWIFCVYLVDVCAEWEKRD